MSIVEWVCSSKNRRLPNGAVLAGTDLDGSMVYVGRSTHCLNQLPCKIVPQRKQAYISQNGTEFEVYNYEVMVQKKLKWVRCEGARIPHDALLGGRTAKGEILYVGRISHGNATCVGKVKPSDSCLYFPYGGQEIIHNDFEILVAR